MKWILVLAPFAVAIIAAVAFVVIAGSLMPREHTATRALRLNQPPEAVWDVVTDFPAIPSWRPSIARCEALPDQGGKPVWNHVSNGAGGDAIPLRVDELSPPARMVTTIADDALPFGGTWMWELFPAEGGCIVRITEDGFVKPAAFRYISRIMGHDATIREYLTDLARKFGESPRFVI
ncbi:MAG: hypothetical protein HBSAPP03_17410 [Phycisphaerae bacterium]|nr:MAG: hypothetical protein HBSAPP03_17410 [Phycisphaerae bacterium]